MPEATFGPYRLDGLLGRGGMGEVHRAYDTDQSRTVALKLLPAALSDDADYRARFQREARIASQLTDPHVVPIHRHGEIDGQLYLDMRLIDGDDLAQVLAAEKRLEPAAAVALVEQVAQALDAAHAQGLVHRDVKPSNVLLARPVRDGGPRFPYLLDFGIARQFSGGSLLTGTGQVIGTLEYMAPERFLCRPVDPRTDVYSLACVLYECLTGVKPFPGDDLPSLMHGHLSVEPPRPSAVAGVPTTLDAVVGRGMAKDPAQRYATAGDLAIAARVALLASAAPTAPTSVSGSPPAPGGSAEPVPKPHAPAPADGSAGTETRVPAPVAAVPRLVREPCRLVDLADTLGGLSVTVVLLGLLTLVGGASKLGVIGLIGPFLAIGAGMVRRRADPDRRLGPAFLLGNAVLAASLISYFWDRPADWQSVIPASLAGAALLLGTFLALFRSANRTTQPYAVAGIDALAALSLFAFAAWCVPEISRDASGVAANLYGPLSGFDITERIGLFLVLAALVVGALRWPVRGGWNRPGSSLGAAVAAMVSLTALANQAGWYGAHPHRDLAQNGDVIGQVIAAVFVTMLILLSVQQRRPASPP